LGLSSTPDYRAAVEVARRVVGWVADGGGFETPVAINVNVPSGPADALRGIRAAGLASFGAVQTNVTELNEDYVSLEFADLDPKQEPGTDAALLADGWATVTALSPVCEADVDLDPLVS
jgi:5'-nucleotidase